MACWSELPEDIIALFAKRLPPIEDFVRFSAVCKSWRSAAIREKQRRRINCFAPWLMLTNRENDKIANDNDEGNITFYCLSSKKLFHIQLPEAQGRRCWGSPYGWLFTVGIDYNIHLLNPLSRIQLSFPSRTTFRYQYDFGAAGPEPPEHFCRVFVKKFALASNPCFWTIPPTLESDKSSVVVAIYGERFSLAFASPGDEAWTDVESPIGCYDDIMFFSGSFYAVDTNGMLRICEITTTPPKTIDIACPPDGVRSTDQFYLIEISGELHLIARVLTADDDAPGCEFHYDTLCIGLFKFDFCEKIWIEVLDLGDHALFIGNNTGFAISTSDYPALKGNSIYFTDDRYECYFNNFCDMGVYDYNEETSESFYLGNADDIFSKLSRPLFFMPSL